MVKYSDLLHFSVEKKYMLIQCCKICADSVLQKCSCDVAKLIEFQKNKLYKDFPVQE